MHRDSSCMMKGERGKRTLCALDLCTCALPSAQDAHRDCRFAKMSGYQIHWRARAKERLAANPYATIVRDPLLTSSLSSLLCAQEMILDEQVEAKDETATRLTTWAERS